MGIVGNFLTVLEKSAKLAKSKIGRGFSARASYHWLKIDRISGIKAF
jgi:hypothetical protein